MTACVGCGREEGSHAPDCPGVPIFCSLCERDIGPVFPKLPNGALPAVEHRPDGSHLFKWLPQLEEAE